MDILGVRSLSIITDCLKMIKQHLSPNGKLQSTKADAGTMAHILLKKSEELTPLDLRAIPEDHPEVTAHIRSGETMGCFQLESPGMRGLIKKMKIEHVDDVITAVALIRPGAAGSGMKDIYIKRRAGLEQVDHVHPALAPALDSTYGVIVYQEQVLQVAHFVAKLSLSEADTLRRAMTKSREKKEFMQVHNAFIDGAVKNGLNHEQAGVVWQFLSQFVGYGFNKAHSATYGTIAYQTVFLKHFFPTEYMCAVLNNQGGFYSRSAYIEETRRMDIRLLPPDVNYSNRHFICENGAIRTGLSPVFELTERTINSILSAREQKPFTSLFDFIQRTRAGEKEVIHLCKCGALNSINSNAPQLMLMAKIYFKNKKKASLCEFITGDTELEPFNRYQKIINEMEILDFAVTAHPMTLFKEHINWDSIISSTELEAHKNDIIKFCGWLVTSRRVATSKNQFMKFLTLEDFKGLCEAVLFPKAYINYGHLIRSHGPYIVTGRVQSRLPGEANLIVEKLEIVTINKEEIEGLLQRKQDFSEKSEHIIAIYN